MAPNRIQVDPKVDAGSLITICYDFSASPAVTGEHSLVLSNPPNDPVETTTLTPEEPCCTVWIPQGFSGPVTISDPSGDSADAITDALQ